jgi:hypothetical protein
MFLGKEFMWEAIEKREKRQNWYQKEMGVIYRKILWPKWTLVWKGLSLRFV